MRISVASPRLIILRITKLVISVTRDLPTALNWRSLLTTPELRAFRTSHRELRKSEKEGSFAFSDPNLSKQINTLCPYTSEVMITY